MTAGVAVFLLFVDGLGLGEPDAHSNPVVHSGLRWLTRAAGRPLARGEWMPGVAYHVVLAGHPIPAALIALDAGLGVAGLPQSATGQTTLFTGVNAAALVGGHRNAHPTGRLKELLHARSMFRRAAEAGRKVTFVNAFTPEYFAMTAEGLRHSATTLAVLAAGVRLRDLEDLRRGEAVYQDVTNLTLQARGHDLPEADPFRAGQTAARTAADYDLAMFEYFQTDRAGHGRDAADVRRVLQVLDSFLGGLLSALDLDRRLLILVSDHGNIEDASSRTHTANPVPALFLGARAHATASGVSSLTQVAPAILTCMGVPA
ncbi:MAG TPA: alkaline phosphatase family protein [Bacillota bacterium]|nr:alkaline phosphatase family protein [Bacillota bacterium]